MSSSSSANSVDTETINDLEQLVVVLSETLALTESKHRYRLAEHDTNDMLDWKNPPQIQPLPTQPFYRVGIVGDGNCMLHTILFATSPTYRRLNYKSQSELTDAFRTVLIQRIDEIEAQANVLYLHIGGAQALADAFEVLQEEREEIDVTLGPAICRLYGHNFLAVRLDEDLVMEPVRQTFNEGVFDPELPTVLVHYMGGDVDVGKGAVYAEDGHYEAIIAAPCITVIHAGKTEYDDSNISSSENESHTAKSGKKTTRHITRKTKHKQRAGIRATLNEEIVTFDFAAGNPILDTVLALFLEEEELEPEYVHPLEAAAKKAAAGGDSFAEGGARRRRRYTRRRPKRNRHSRQ